MKDFVHQKKFLIRTWGHYFLLVTFSILLCSLDAPASGAAAPAEIDKDFIVTGEVAKPAIFPFQVPPTDDTAALSASPAEGKFDEEETRILGLIEAGNITRIQFAASGYFDTKNYEAAKRLYQTVWENDPEDGNILGWFGLTLLLCDDPVDQRRGAQFLYQAGQKNVTAVKMFLSSIDCDFSEEESEGEATNRIFVARQSKTEDRIWTLNL